MKVEKRASGPQTRQYLQLAMLLDWEEENYRRLLRLAWRQNSYMKRQDVDRLEDNAEDWSKHLPEANQARVSRERYVGELGATMGLKIPPGSIGDLLDGADENTRRRLGASVLNLKRTVQKLARQNELNRSLAEFCLDLAHEETEIFKRCVLEDPNGTYGDNARKADRGPGGVLIRQA